MNLTFFFLAQVFDSGTTYAAVRFFGLNEGNPIVDYLFSVFGMEWVLVSKILMAAVVGIFWINSHRLKQALEYAMVVSGTVTWMIVIANLWHISHASRIL